MAPNKAKKTSGVKATSYPMLFLLTLLFIAVGQGPACPAVSRAVDAKGTIHINNDPKAESGPDRAEAASWGQTESEAGKNSPEPTPSNIFPEPQAPAMPAFLSAEPKSQP